MLLTHGKSRGDSIVQKKIIVCIVCFMAGFLCSYIVFCYGYHSAGIESVRNQLESARDNQHEQSETIKRIEQTTSGIENAEREAGNLIKDSERIVKGIRERNENKK